MASNEDPTDDDAATVWELFDLSDSVAIVTGGTGRLGTQVCDALAEAGANVVVAARNLNDCRDRAAALTEEYSECLPVQVDATDPESVDEMVASTLDSFGGVDVLVNCAHSGRSAAFEEMSVEQWRSAFHGATTSTFLCSRAAAEVMRAEGGGSIVNFGSVYGVVSPDHRIYGQAGNASPPNYGPAKAAVVQFTRWLATYLAPDGIRVNCVSPGGFFDADRADADPHYEEFVRRYRERTPLGRMGGGTDLKGPIVFLASDASAWMTGQNVVVDGGWTVW